MRVRVTRAWVILGAAPVVAPSQAWGGCCLMAVLVREAKSLRVDFTVRVSDS